MSLNENMVSEITEKLMTASENVPRVYAAGRERGEADGYERGYAEGLSEGYTIEDIGRAVANADFRTLGKMLIIPDDVTVIKANAFYGANLTMGVKFPNNLQTIGNNAFANANRGSNVTILPDSVTTVGNSAFLWGSLTGTKLPDSLTSVGTSAFLGTGITFTELPLGLTAIPDQAFGYLNITNVTFHAGITTIGSKIFRSCVKLTSVTFKGTPTSMSATAFGDCSALTDIYVPWAEGEVAGAPWGATNATIHYNFTEGTE